MLIIPHYAYQFITPQVTSFINEFRHIEDMTALQNMHNKFLEQLEHERYQKLQSQLDGSSPQLQNNTKTTTAPPTTQSKGSLTSVFDNCTSSKSTLINQQTQTTFHQVEISNSHPPSENAIYRDNTPYYPVISSSRKSRTSNIEESGSKNKWKFLDLELNRLFMIVAEVQEYVVMSLKANSSESNLHALLNYRNSADSVVNKNYLVNVSGSSPPPASQIRSSMSNFDSNRDYNGTVKNSNSSEDDSINRVIHLHTHSIPKLKQLIQQLTLERDHLQVKKKSAQQNENLFSFTATANQNHIQLTNELDVAKKCIDELDGENLDLQKKIKELEWQLKCADAKIEGFLGYKQEHLVGENKIMFPPIKNYNSANDSTCI